MSLKNHLIVLFVVLFCTFSNASASAADYSANSSDALINKAISLTESISPSAIKVLAGENSTKQPIKIQFTNLSKLSYEYMNTDAVTVIDENGKMNIYIDDSHKNAPAEAIACIIEHETTHSDSVSSINEEILAWTKEATSWIYFTQRNPSLAKMDETKIALIDRLNYITELYTEAGNTNREIKREILSNGVYSNLAMHSEGF